MKITYCAPEADVIDLQAMESIALYVDPKEARDNGDPSAGRPGTSMGTGDFGGDY